MWFQQQDNCIRPYICEVVTLSPGETLPVQRLRLHRPGLAGLGLDPHLEPAGGHRHGPRRAGPAHDLPGRAGRRSTTPSTARPYFTAGSTVAYGPLIYSEYQGWDTGIQVQNLTPTYAAKVKVYFYDRSGDIITTLVDWVCPRGSQTFYLPAIATLPGNWVGSVRVESQEWFDARRPVVPADADLGGGAAGQLRRHPAPDGQPGHRLQPACRSTTRYDWQLGGDGGGRASGATVLAVPSLLEGPGGHRRDHGAGHRQPGAQAGVHRLRHRHLRPERLHRLRVREAGATSRWSTSTCRRGATSTPASRAARSCRRRSGSTTCSARRGEFLRNLVGLGAVSDRAQRDDAAAERAGRPGGGQRGACRSSERSHFSGPAGPICPGLEGAPPIPDCPPQVIRHSGNMNLRDRRLGHARPARSPSRTSRPGAR